MCCSTSQGAHPLLPPAPPSHPQSASKAPQAQEPQGSDLIATVRVAAPAAASPASAPDSPVYSSTYSRNLDALDVSSNVASIFKPRPTSRPSSAPASLSGARRSLAAALATPAEQTQTCLAGTETTYDMRDYEPFDAIAVCEEAAWQLGPNPAPTDGGNIRGERLLLVLEVTTGLAPQLEDGSLGKHTLDCGILAARALLPLVAPLAHMIRYHFTAAQLARADLCMEWPYKVATGLAPKPFWLPDNLHDILQPVWSALSDREDWEAEAKAKAELKTAEAARAVASTLNPHAAEWTPAACAPAAEPKPVLAETTEPSSKAEQAHLLGLLRKAQSDYEARCAAEAAAAEKALAVEETSAACDAVAEPALMENNGTSTAEEQAHLLWLLRKAQSEYEAAPAAAQVAAIRTGKSDCAGVDTPVSGATSGQATPMSESGEVAWALLDQGKRRTHRGKRAGSGRGPSRLSQQA